MTRGLAERMAWLITGAGLLLWSGASVSAPAAEPKGVAEFLSPADGSHLPGGKVIVTGRLAKGREKAALFFNGRPLQGSARMGSGFWAGVTPQNGRNVVEARDKQGTSTLTFTYGPGGQGRPLYGYHQPLREGDCQSCHDPKSPARTAVKSKTCFRCHDGFAYPYLHGPVGAGECNFCHDPHGSARARLMRFDRDSQCSVCHDQPASREHMTSRQNKDCHRCHDPHGGKDQNFLKK